MSLTDLLSRLEQPGRLVHITTDILIDGSDPVTSRLLLDLPYPLDDRGVDFDHHQVTIRNCQSWPGLFTVAGGCIRNLKVDFDSSNTLLANEPDGDYGAVLVYSCWDQPAHGTFQNISLQIRTPGDLKGTLVGPYALKDSKMFLYNISIDLEARHVDGLLIGPFMCYGSSKSSSLTIDKFQIDVRATSVAGLVSGNGFGSKSDPKFCFQLAWMSPPDGDINATILADERSAKFFYVFGCDPVKPLNIVMLSPGIRTD